MTVTDAEVPLPRTEPKAWFSDATEPEEPSHFCLVCWGYGGVVTRHRSRQP